MFNKIKKLYGRMVVFGKKIARIQVRIMFWITYYLFIVPLGYIVKSFLRSETSGWHNARENVHSIEEARRQF